MYNLLFKKNLNVFKFLIVFCSVIYSEENNENIEVNSSKNIDVKNDNNDYTSNDKVIDDNSYTDVTDDNNETRTDNNEFIIGDNLDIKTFKKKYKDFFHINIISISFNDLLYTKNLCKSQFKSNFFSNFCENIKYLKWKIFCNNSISFGFNYNIHIGKGFTFSVGLSLRWKSFMYNKFIDEEYKTKALNYFSQYHKKNERETLEQPANSPQINDKDKKDVDNLIKKYKEKEDKYNEEVDNDKNKEVCSVHLFYISTLIGFSWYSNLYNRNKSLYIKLFLSPTYQRASMMYVKSDNGIEKIEGKRLRFIKPCIYLFLEIGYRNFSIELYTSLLPLLDDNIKFDETVSKINLLDYGLSLKFNIL